MIHHTTTINEKRKARWARIAREASKLENLVEVAVADPRHVDHEHCIHAQEHVNGAVSMAGMAIDGDYGVDPPPRGASTESWYEAYGFLKQCENADIRTAIRHTALAYRGRAK